MLARNPVVDTVVDAGGDVDVGAGAGSPATAGTQMSHTTPKREQPRMR
jgi:hypothetical protein